MIIVNEVKHFKMHINTFISALIFLFLNCELLLASTYGISHVHPRIIYQRAKILADKSLLIE